MGQPQTTVTCKTGLSRMQILDAGGGGKSLFTVIQNRFWQLNKGTKRISAYLGRANERGGCMLGSAVYIVLFNDAF